MEPIGAGGMGEVFRARDSRLDRDVAVKVLPTHLALSPQLRERFDREARSISALNHPNICTLYDVGHQDGVDYIVMELLEGETLAERLSRGPLPFEQVLHHGAQIAEGLDRAHRLGIVHRDLKPGNIMITKTGAKLLDFGLAKTASPSPSSADAPTEQQKPLTAEGTLLGTFQYMAPEQLEGEEADARTDIFALGAVLYEMATGRRAFNGKTRTSIIAAIVSSEPPPLSQVQPTTPPALEHVIRKCLAKERDDRWQSAHDIAANLRWLAASDSAAGPAAPYGRRKGKREVAVAVVAAVALIAATLLGVLWRRERTIRESVVVSSSINAPAGAEYATDGGIALSPDGTRLAFVNEAVEERSRRVHIRHLATGAVQSLAGSEGAQGVFWSPDGRNLGFFAGGKLKRTAASGGAAQTICAAESPRGGTWSQDGTIVFTPVFRDGLFSVPAAGGEPKRLTTPDPARGETNHRWPHFLPDGRHVLFLTQRAEGGSADDPSTIEVYSLDSGKRKRILPANSSAVYSQGNILYWREGNLLAQKFDAEKLHVSGEAFVVATDAEYDGNEQVLVSASAGNLAYVVGGAAANTRLIWVDRSGRELGTLAEHSPFVAPALSPEGNLVAVGIAQSSQDIWALDINRKTRSRVTSAPGDEYGPVWSSDGSRVAYASNEAPLGVWTVPSTGGEGERLWQGENPIARGWSRDGLILIEFNDSKLKWGFGVFSVVDRQFRRLVQTPFMDVAPTFSPDGRWIAFMSDQSGRFEIYVMSLATKQQWQVSTDGGAFPRWARDGGEIYFLNAQQEMLSVSVELAPRFTAGNPETLFRVAVAGGEEPQYDVLDRNRFLINTPAADTKRETITLIQNWTRLRKD